MDLQTPTLSDFIRTIFAISPEESEVKTLAKELDRISQEIKNCKPTKPTSFFGFEGIGKKIKSRKSILEEQRKRLQEEIKYLRLCHETNLKMLQAGYIAELDYSPLAWRKKWDKLPAFIILNLDNDVFSITIRIDDDGSTVVNWQPKNLPLVIKKQYSDALNEMLLMAETKKHNHIQITAKFQGVVPEKTREKITSAKKSGLFDKIFIIAEAPEWRVNSTRIVNTDPIVVGWVEQTLQMFVVDIFDPTPLEFYLQEQHTL